jgi:hypothetical protein
MTICDPRHGGSAPAIYAARKSDTDAVARRDPAMDATYFRDKAATCMRLARGLSWNNPARHELMELAQEFQRQAEELEACATAQPPPAS